MWRSRDDSISQSTLSAFDNGSTFTSHSHVNKQKCGPKAWLIMATFPQCVKHISLCMQSPLCLFVWMVWCNNYSVFCWTGLLWVPLKCTHDYSFIDRLSCIHQTLSLLLPKNQDEVHFPASCLLRSDGSLHHEHERRKSLYSPRVYKFNIKPTPPPAFYHMDQSKPKELLF